MSETCSAGVVSSSRGHVSRRATTPSATSAAREQTDQIKTSGARRPGPGLTS